MKDAFRIPYNEAKKRPPAITNVQVKIVELGTDRLVGWASCVFAGSIRLDDIGIRRGYDGGLFLTYPNKVTAGGSKHPYFSPISGGAAKAVEDAILSKLAELARMAAPGNSPAT